MGKSDEFYHSGVKGMEWYKRRYQNEDGSLTPEGRIHYGVGEPRQSSSETGAEKIKRAYTTFRDKYRKEKTKIKRKVTIERKKIEKAAAEKEKRKKAAQDAAAKEIFKSDYDKYKNMSHEQRARLYGERDSTFKDWTDDELKRYAERKKLERAAEEERIQQFEKYQKYGAAAAKYMKTGYDLYSTYRNIKGVSKDLKEMKNSQKSSGDKKDNNGGNNNGGGNNKKKGQQQPGEVEERINGLLKEAAKIYVENDIKIKGITVEKKNK